MKQDNLKFEYPKVSVEIKKQVRDLLIDLTDSFSFSNYLNSRNEIEMDISRLISSNTKWKNELGEHSRKLFLAYDMIAIQRICVCKEVEIGIGAFLMYLSEPFDVIPDFEPTLGFADDYYALEYTLKKIKSLDKSFLLKLKSIDEIDHDS